MEGDPVIGNALESVLSDLESSKLPQSLLFAGGDDSFLFENAIDLVYGMTTGYDKIRKPYPDVIYAPESDGKMMLDASYKYYASTKTDRGKRFFIFTLRRLLMQYHSAFQRDGKDQKDVLYAKAADVDELLGSLIEKEGDDAIQIAGGIYNIASSEDFLSKGKKKAGLTMEEARSVISYAEKSSSLKFFLIDNLEDLGESVRNALLKTLEEPPEGLYTILLSKNSERMMKTILSRVRKYYFPNLSNAELNAYLKESYLTRKNYDSLSSFYMDTALSAEEKENFYSLSAFLLESIGKAKMPDAKAMNEKLSFLDKGKAGYFMPIFTEELKKRVSDGTFEYWTGNKILNAFSSSYRDHIIYSTNIRVALDGALREALTCR